MSKPDPEQRLAQELRFHLEEQVRRYQAEGIAEPEAWRRARLDFGGLEAIKQECRDVRRFAWLEDLGRDVHYGLRSLARAPGFAAVAIATLALGIGANTAVFSLVHRVLIARLPVEQPERLVVVSRSDPEQNETQTFPQLFFRRLEAEPDLFAGVLARGGSERVTVGLPEGGAPAIGELVSGSYFEVLGVRPHLGRLLTRNDDVTPGGHPVVVLSHRYWLKQFAGDPNVVGRTLRLTGYPMTVIGVSPPGFEGLDPGQAVDLRLPLAMLAEVRSGPGVRRAVNAAPRDTPEFNLVARLQEGSNHDLVERRVSEALQRFRAESLTGGRSPFAASERARLRPAATGFGRTRRQFQATLWVLWGITAALFAIACLNLANLLLARSAARRQELAIRLSLGAGSGRLARQLLTESVLLSLFGGAAGMLLAYAGSLLLARLIAGNAAAPAIVAQPSGPVFVFHWAVALASGLVFGSAPAWDARRLDIVSRLKRTTGEGSSGFGGRKLLCGAQVALSVVVLVGAGLFLRTLDSLTSASPGFRADRLLIAALSPKNAGRPDAEVLPFFRAVRERVLAVPGVEAASYAMVRLVSGNSWTAAVVVTGSEATPARAERNVVGPAYFATLEIPLLAGREFSESDDRLAPRVAIVSESFAKVHFAGRDPLGQRIGVETPDITIVGVARDTKYARLREPAQRVWYVPHEQYPSTKYLDLYVRTAGEPSAMGAPIRSTIASVDGSVALFDVRSQQDQIDETLVSERMLATLASFFGALAAALAALGLYGVLSLLVATRRREIGIRTALGARPAATAWQVAREAWRIIGVGILAGLLVGIALGRSVATLLHGVSPLDPTSLAGAATAMAFLATVAVLVPALRAARIDPLQVIREP